MRESMRAPRRRAVTASALAVTIAGALLALLHTGGAGAHITAANDGQGSPVTFRNSDCTTPADPINIVVFGSTATPEDTAIHIREHTPAGGSGRGSAQYVSTHGRCVPTQAGAKGGKNAEGTYHNRVFQNAGDE